MGFCSILRVRVQHSFFLLQSDLQPQLGDGSPKERVNLPRAAAGGEAVICCVTHRSPFRKLSGPGDSQPVSSLHGGIPARSSTSPTWLSLPHLCAVFTHRIRRCPRSGEHHDGGAIMAGAPSYRLALGQTMPSLPSLPHPL